ncbi:MAG: hypothetical protein M1824_004476 [Vezdaea acicularis]|nr:MAG: hypothetical protein M1824_004476 [Vezdaea acicularis]
MKLLPLCFLLLPLFFASLIQAPDPPQRGHRQQVDRITPPIQHAFEYTPEQLEAMREILQSLGAELRRASTTVHGFGSELDIICFGELPAGTGPDGHYGLPDSRFRRSDFTSLTDLCSHAGNPNGNLRGCCMVPDADHPERRRVVIPAFPSHIELCDRTLQEHCRMSCICLQNWRNFWRDQHAVTTDNIVQNLRDALYPDDIPLELTERIVELRDERRLNRLQQWMLESPQDSSQLTCSGPWTDQDSCSAIGMMRGRTRPSSDLSRTSYTARTRRQGKESNLLNGVSMAVTDAGSGRRKMGLLSALESLGSING